MNVLKTLRNKSIGKTIPVVLALLVAATIVFVAGGAYNLPKMMFPKTLAQLTPETMEGAYVKDDIYYIYSGFAYETETQNGRDLGKTRVWYITEFDEDYYMAMSVGKKDIAYADALMEEYWDYLEYGTVPENEEWMILPISGTIHALDSDLSEYYYDGVSADTKARMLPYSLDEGMLGNQTTALTTLSGAGSLVLAFLAVLFMVRAASGYYQKDLLKTLDRMGNRDMMIERLNNFCSVTPAVHGVQMGKEFVLIQVGAKMYLYSPQDIAWAYESVTQHRTNGIPTGKSYAVQIMTMSGKQHTLGLNKRATEELLVEIARQLPGVTLGYNDETAALYKNNRQVFAQRWAAVQYTAPQAARPVAPTTGSAPIY